MVKRVTACAVLAFLLFGTLRSVNAAVWDRMKSWTNQYVSFDTGSPTCYTFPNEHAPIQRIHLKPLTRNPNLTVYGYRNGSWTTIAIRALSGLTHEVVSVPRGTYSYFQACVSSAVSPGSGYSLFYEGHT
jgi:hypothetical protein